MAFDPIENFASARHEFGEHGGVNMSIEASTTFTVMHAKTLPEIFGGERGPDDDGCFLYSRHFNPTVYTLGHGIAAIEGAETGYCTSSGLGAIASTLMQLCAAGDEIVSANTIYGGTFALMNDYFPVRTGVRTKFVDITDLGAVEAAITDKTRVLYCETLSNPTLRVSNIPALAKIAKAKGVKLVVDNTFSPMVFSPIQLGADIVVYSLTKFIGGASDIVAGAICGPKEFIQSLMDVHSGSLMLLGPTMDPQTAFQLSLRLPHLGIRMVEHGRRAQVFAERCEALGLEVEYPGLAAHPQHELAKQLMNPEYGFGGLFTVDLGTTARANAFMDTLQNKHRFGYMAVSLGYFDTLMSCSASSTSSEMTAEALREAGIAPGLVRVAIGYTGSLEQRWGQFEAALQEVGAVGAGV